MKEFTTNSLDKFEIHFILGDVSSRGGIERVTITLANSLSSICKVKLISLYQTKNKLSFNVSEKVSLEIINNKHEVSMYNRKMGTVKGLFFDFLYIKKKSGSLKKIAKSNNAIAITSDVKMTLLAKVSGYKNIIAVEHFEYDVISPILKVVRKLLYKKISCVISQTEEDKKKYDWLPADKHCVIPNIVEEPNQITCYEKRSKIVLAVGRLTHQKGFDLLLRSWKRINAPDWKLKIVGEGEEFRNLQYFIKSNKLTNVILCPFSNAIEQHYNDAKIFVLSSRYEGLGMVLVEALSYGLACISFDCPAGPRTILNQDNGILIEPENVESLTAYLQELIGNRELQNNMNKSAIASIDRFKSSVIIEQWISIIRDVK
ncbi:glycosyltransferase family 4 protein [Pantoea sp. JK]|uniref:glycosyltransferase family 4 protein n=1 Tax=Pantoea sp. JK TaxID=2871703 RepID=UPI0022379F83|nr:glycosyltransferase family 4 protein [Pantoea sp. JK]MCW6033884.1 glycosyltransferase family 4 protein [Pantoea sp. JK]